MLEQHATIGGQPAVIYNNLPGFFAQRGAFIVANDIKYQIVIQPLPGDVPELGEQATQDWDTVTQSIVFFPPQNERVVVRSDDVCPEAKEGAILHVNLVDGYCLLLPERCAVDPNFPARIVGGPEYGPVEGFDSVRASLGIGVYALGEQTAERALRPISEQIDANSVQTTTIAGYPAVVYDFTGGPWRQRNAQIVVGDWVLHLRRPAVGCGRVPGGAGGRGDAVERGRGLHRVLRQVAVGSRSRTMQDLRGFRKPRRSFFVYWRPPMPSR